MLQPMQPTGQQPQKPGVNMPGGMPQQGAPQPGRPQTMPAGAAQASTLLPGGITNSIQDIKDAYGSNPQRLQQAQQQGDILSAIALQQILEEQKSKKRQMELDKAKQSGQPGTIIEQKQQEAVELRRQDLEQQQAARLGVENQRSQSALAQIGQQAARPQQQMQQPQPMPRPGIAGIPAPNAAEPRAMAAGGIVAFDEGGNVNPPTNQPQVTEQQINEILSANPNLTRDQAIRLAMGKPLTEPRPVGLPALSDKQMVQQMARQKMSLDPEQQAARTREEYAKYAGYSPEEKAAQEKRIAETEAYDKQAYNPDRLQNEGLAAFLMGAAGKGGIGETLAGAGSAGLNYSNKMRELSRQRMSDRQKQAEDFMEAQRGARVKGFDAGQTARKETIGEQATGLKELGDIYATDVQAATARQRIGAGGGSGNKALEDASQAVARDGVIGALKGKLKDELVGSPEYDRIVAQIESRAKAIYDAFKAPYPEMPAPEQRVEPPKEEGTLSKIGKGIGSFVEGIGRKSQNLQVSQPAQAMPATKDQLVVGKVYNTAKGPATWDGQQFVK